MILHFYSEALKIENDFSKSIYEDLYMETIMEKQLHWLGIYCHDCKAPLSAARISLESL